jgi:alginate O-acetyltransferase complex protein AlgI
LRVLFNTKAFVLFLAIVVPVYYALRDEGKRNWLLLASYAFYGFVDPRLVPLVSAAIGLSFASALGTERAGDHQGWRRFWLWLGVGGNLAVLVLFKYWNFGVRSAIFWSETLHLPLDFSALALNLILPVGISFYTFKLLSYNIDVHWRKLGAERSFRDFALYVMFFPRLPAGPVERATYQLPQLKLPFSLTPEQVCDGVFLILLGFVKKVVIADRLANWIAPQFRVEVHEPAIAWTSVLLFTLNIYTDFSAYTDIAIGLGRLLGYDIRPNFNLAFIVPSISERWRRWHISMSQWFRDYVYYRLGGNRHGEARANLNIMIVMFLSGLWHGASYNFVIWGVLNGLSMVGNRISQPVLKPIATRMDRNPYSRWGWYYLCCAVTMLMISSINIFFRSDTWPVARSYVHTMFLTNPWRFVTFVEEYGVPDGYIEGFVFFALVTLAHELERHLGIQRRILGNRTAWTAVCTVMFAVIVLYGVKGGQFIYYQF